jgi:hypothetical protein
MDDHDLSLRIILSYVRLLGCSYQLFVPLRELHDGQHRTVDLAVDRPSLGRPEDGDLPVYNAALVSPLATSLGPALRHLHHVQKSGEKSAE